MLSRNSGDKMINTLVQKVILQRTGLRAVINGETINGCGECKHNREVPGLLEIAPGHLCDASPLEGPLHVIFDPYNIPKWCPYKIEDGQK